MKRETKLPTPAELAVFIRAVRPSAEIPFINHNDFDEAEADFITEAFKEWLMWELVIRVAESDEREERAVTAKKLERVSLSEAMRELEVRDIRTLESYFAPGYGPGGKEYFKENMKRGFNRAQVDRMRAERDRRASERAKKGAAAKAEKQRKKFEQEKEREVQQQAAPTQQQAGKKRTPRRSKRKP